jgi:hypothetical protein
MEQVNARVAVAAPCIADPAQPESAECHLAMTLAVMRSIKRTPDPLAS